MKRYNMHYVQRNPDEYFQPYAMQNAEGQWCQWKDVKTLQTKLETALEALDDICTMEDILGGLSVEASMARDALKEIAEVNT